MPRRAPPPTLADSPDELEAMFYEALQQGRLEQLMSLWADDDEVVCVHPGGGRDIGAQAIRASFQAIFASGGIPVQPEQVHRLQQPGFALHHLVERIEVQGEQGAQVGWVLTTNLYVKTDVGWRIAAHHASAGLPQGRSLHGGDAPSTLH
jgi:uncharacterized protein (TIGR02246 family)